MYVNMTIHRVDTNMDTSKLKLCTPVPSQGTFFSKLLMNNNDEPVYFSDIFVHKDNTKINSLDDLDGHIWAYNDTESLSGYYCIKNTIISC